MTTYSNEGHALLCAVLDQMTGAELARLVGKTRAIVSVWRQGKAVPHPKTRQVLFEVVGIPTDAWTKKSLNPLD